MCMAMATCRTTQSYSYPQITSTDQHNGHLYSISPELCYTERQTKRKTNLTTARLFSLFSCFAAASFGLGLGVGFGKFRSFGFGVLGFLTISDFGWYISVFRFRSFGVLVVRGSALYVYTELRAPWLVLGCKN